MGGFDNGRRGDENRKLFGRPESLEDRGISPYVQNAFPKAFHW